jgi:hypothetical protein
MYSKLSSLLLCSQAAFSEDNSKLESLLYSTEVHLLQVTTRYVLMPE